MVTDCQILFPELSSPDSQSRPSAQQYEPAKFPSLKPAKSFAQALNNTCDIPLSQLPIPCIKGDAIAVKIPEEEYVAGVESCKNHLHGRLMLSKGDVPYKIDDLRQKLLNLWKPLSHWKIIPIGRGFYEFSFSSIEDLRKVLAVGSWSLAPGILRLFSWTPDFSPNLVKQTNTQCWIRILDLPQEYWRPKILFAIARGIGTPLSLDDATINKSLGHYARVLVDLDLAKPLQDQILVEREGYAFLVGIYYERLPLFCSSCAVIGHSLSNCKKNKQHEVKEVKNIPRNKKVGMKYVPKSDPKNQVAGLADPALNGGRTNDEIKQDFNSRRKAVMVQDSADILQKGVSSHDDRYDPTRFVDPIAGQNLALEGELRGIGIFKPIDDQDHRSDKDDASSDEESMDNVYDEDGYADEVVQETPKTQANSDDMPKVVQDDIVTLHNWGDRVVDESDNFEEVPNQVPSVDDEGFETVQTKSQKKKHRQKKKASPNVIQTRGRAVSKGLAQ